MPTPSFDLSQLDSAGLKLGNYNQANDSATLYQPGNGNNASGTRTVSGISGLGIDTSKLGTLDQSLFTNGRSLGNINGSDLSGMVSGYNNGAANDAKAQAEQTAATNTPPAAPTTQNAYGDQLQGNTGPGKEPSQIAPGVPNPFATNTTGLNTATTPTADQQSKFQQSFNQAKSAGIPSPTDGGAGRTLTEQTDSGTNQNIDNFFATNGTIQATNQQLQDYLSPPATQATLQNYIDQLSSDRSSLNGLNTQLMNNKNIIAGTEQDIRDEITKANGFATNSQVMALATARNKTLIQQDTQLADLITSATNAVSTDTTLLTDEKQQAQQETATRMNLLQFQQKNNEDMFNAANDTYKTLMQNDPAGLYASLQSDPTQAARFTAITGLNMNELQSMDNPKAADGSDYNTYKNDTVAKGLTPLDRTGWLAQKSAQAIKTKGQEAFQTGYNTEAGKNAAINANSGTPGATLPSNLQSQVDKVNSSLAANKTVQAFQNVADNYKVINTIPDSTTDPTQQSILLTAVAHILSPNSPSLRGALNAIDKTSLQSGVYNTLNSIAKTFESKGTLSPDALNTLKTQAQNIYSGYLDSYNALRSDAITPALKSSIPDIDTRIDNYGNLGIAPPNVQVENFITSQTAKGNIDPSLNSKISALTGGKTFKTPGELVLYMSSLPGATPEGVLKVMTNLGYTK